MEPVPTLLDYFARSADLNPDPFRDVGGKWRDAIEPEIAIDVSGDCDDSTQAKLVKVHGA